MRKDYDTLERLASDIVMGDIKALHAAKAAGASAAISRKNAPEKGSMSLLEARVKDKVIQAGEGNRGAKMVVRNISGEPKTKREVAGQKLRIAGKKILRGVRRASRKLPDPFPEAGAKDAARDSELKKMGVMPTSQRHGGKTYPPPQGKEWKPDKTGTVTSESPGRYGKKTKTNEAKTAHPSLRFSQRKDPSLPRSSTNTKGPKEVAAQDTVRAQRVLKTGKKITPGGK